LSNFSRFLLNFSQNRPKSQKSSSLLLQKSGLMYKHSYTLNKFKVVALAFTAAFINCSSAHAQTASAAGSATLTVNPTITVTVTNGVTQSITQGGFTTSVAAETVLPVGLFYGGPLVVTPTFANQVVSSLSINPGIIAVVPESATFNRSVAQILVNVAASNSPVQNLDAISAIIKAGAGINGLD
jgi:hypothetical protein